MTEPESRERRLPWTRLAAEFVVIVVGVLIALGVDALRAQREDRARVAEYMTNLVPDLEDTRIRLDSAIAEENRALGAGLTLLVRLARPEEHPPDSLNRLFLDMYQWSNFSPVSETMEALVASGDLRLVRSPEVRRAVFNYSTAIADFVETRAFQAASTEGATGRLYQIVNMAALFEVGGRDPTTDWVGLSARPGLHSDILLVANAPRLKLRRLRSMEEALDTLIDELRLELEGR